MPCVAALFACLGALLTTEASAQTRRPVVVELFTAQGCAACPDANLRLAALAEREDVLLLTWSVDYWDYLGWRDTLARPEAAERQRAYVRRLALRRPSTPQVIVDGADAAVGRSEEGLTRLLEENAPDAGVDLRLAADGSRVWVGSGRPPRGGGEVWLIRYEPSPEAVLVADGENRGREVRVVNAVRSVERLGAWNGRPAVWRLPEGNEALRTAVLLQEADGGRMLGAVAQPQP